MLLLYYVRTFTNALFLFFCRFRTWRLGIDAQDSWKGNCEGGGAVYFVFIMEECLLTFFFFFLVDFGLGDLEDSWKR